MWLNLGVAGLTPGELRESAVKVRDEAAAKLTPVQLARAQEMARKWRPSIAPTAKDGSGDYGQAGANPFQAEIERRAHRNREAQLLLADLGYDLGLVDGMLGPRTRAAIRAFQADAGLPVDGEISDALYAALKDAVATGRRVAAPSAPASPRLDGTDKKPWDRDWAAAQPSRQRRLESTGTGFAVSQDGQIVTNHHVVADCAGVRVRPSGPEAAPVGAPPLPPGFVLEFTPAVVVARDPGNDLALLKAAIRLPAAVLRDDRGIRAGDSVVAVGFPLPGLLASEANVTTGTVSALAGIGNDTRFLQMTVPVQPGNSGGPLLDLEGRVVGVVVGKLDALKVASVTGDIPQNVNFAIKAEVLRRFLNASGVTSGAGRGETERWGENDPLAGGPAAIGAEAKAFTVLVECWK